ncbi:MAG: preprotein translocase subunit SecG [Spirochaetes bacterium]|nr:MAG: preprotein translocase subunit SecG [Spirochaetota bacterium]
MGIVGVLLLVIFIISALLLMLFVLIQDEQGEGLGGIFGGGSGSAFGPRTGNVLTKITSILAVIFLTGAFGLAWINRTPEAGNIVGKARVETLKESKNDWWVQTSSKSATSTSDKNTSAAENNNKTQNTQTAPAAATTSTKSKQEQ